jgi:glycosyltransferase involved in cell wall biosynthesis
MGLKNQHIFIFSIMRFDGPLASTNYTIARFLAKDNFVYYVDMPLTFKDYFNFRGTPQFNIRKPYFFSSNETSLDTDLPNLKIIITPPVPSINFLPEGKLFRLALLMNEQIVAQRIKRVIRQHQIDQFIFINSFNFYYPTIHRLIKPTMSVYHCVDPLITGYETKHGIISEDLLVSEADLVLCTSKELFRKKKLLNDNTFFIPNAADIRHSEKALDSHLPVHVMFNNIKKPVIGYFGNIERRTDFTLLKQVFEKNPEKSFVFVGPMGKEYIPDWFEKVPNLYLPGPSAYADLPSILKGFDVAIIPFKKDEGSNKIFPLKLFEYMGAGKPVVATDFNEDLVEFTADTVSYCKDEPEFTRALNAALNDTEQQKQQRLAIAAKNTWEHRLAEIDQLLALNYTRKLSGGEVTA